MSQENNEIQPGLAAAEENRPVMMRSNIPLPPRLETKRNLAENWKIWKQIWESYEIVSNLVKQEDQYRVATFTTCVGFEFRRA